MSKWKLYRSKDRLVLTRVCNRYPYDIYVEKFIFVEKEFIFTEIDTEIFLIEGEDFELKDIGGRYYETTYDQPDRYEPNYQPFFKEGFIKQLERDFKINNII